MMTCEQTPTLLYEYRLPCIASIAEYNMSPQRLLRLAGRIVREASIVPGGDNTLIVSVRVSDIMDTFGDNPEQLFWNGVFEAAQPASYGIKQDELVEPVISFQIDA